MSDVLFNFHEKNFVVVGASSGMGKQIALELAKAGAQVLAIARNRERLDALQELSPTFIETASLDVMKATEHDWTELLDRFIQQHGKTSGMVYTAGIAATTPLRFYDESLAREIMETGFWGALRLMPIISKKLYANEASSYVIFSSTAGYTGERGLSVYSATKAAMKVAARSMAHDLAKNKHRINTISPGYVRTDMTERSIDAMGRPTGVIQRHLLGIGMPENVSGTVMFLLSNRAKWITGEDFVVDGGYLRGAWC